MNKIKTILLCWIFVGLVSGCRHTHSALNKVGSEESAVLSPAVIDVGNVRSSLIPLTVNTMLKNNGDKPLTILDVLPDCGCTVLEKPSQAIPAKEEIQLPVKVSLFGRFGEFEHKILIKTDAEPEDIELTIKGKAITDLWPSGQSIRCTAEPGSPAFSTIKLHTIDYPDVNFDWSKIDNNIKVKELSRTTEDDETTIKFSIEVDMNGNEYCMQSLTFVPRNHSIMPITVPVHCYTNKVEYSNPSVLTQEINIGMIKSNESIDVPIYCDPDLIRSIDQVVYVGSPENTIVTLQPVGTSMESIFVNLQFPQMSVNDLIKGQLKLTTFAKREFSLPVSGAVGQETD